MKYMADIASPFLTEFEMQQVAPEALMVVKVLEKTHEKLGSPTDATNETGWRMVDAIIHVWKKLFPRELDDWNHELQNELVVERTVRQALKANGGYFPVSYPTRVYRMLEYFLPNQKLHDWDFMRKLVTRYPFLKTTNAHL